MIVAVVTDEPLADRFHHLPVAQQVVIMYSEPAGGREDADRAVEGVTDVAGVLEGFPRALEEETVLRIEHGRVARAHAEERRVEPVDVVEPAAGLARTTGRAAGRVNRPKRSVARRKRR